MLRYRLVEESISTVEEAKTYLEANKLDLGKLLSNPTAISAEFASPLEVATIMALGHAAPQVKEVYYHLYPFTTDDRTWLRPDFTIPQIQINGKYLVLDPHGLAMGLNGGVTGREELTQTGFKKIWGGEFYRVLISLERKRDLAWKTYGKINEFADEVWSIRGHRHDLNNMSWKIARHISALVSEHQISPSYSMDKLAEPIIRAEKGRVVRAELLESVRRERF